METAVTAGAVAAGYKLTNRGLYFCPKSDDDSGVEIEPIWLSPPFAVTARSQDEDGFWGKVLVWRDHDGREVQWVMDARLLGGDVRNLWQSFYERGLEITGDPKRRSLLLRYLIQEKPIRRARVVDRLGWHTDHGQPTFVLPDAAYGAGADKMVEFIYRDAGGQNNPYRVKGSVEDWREHIGRLCIGNSRLALATSLAFASSLLLIVGEQSGGVHFVGESSHGKTTGVIVGASVGGAPKDIVVQWRATSNGLEAVCEQRCDGLLCLDEMGQVDAKEAGEIAYMIANNKGKSRMSRSAEARKSKEWRLLFLSSGEISLGDKMAEVGKKSRAGQEIRLLDIPADAGVGMGMFENLHGTGSAGAFAEQLKRAAQECHGAPLREFVEQIAQWLANDPEGTKSALRDLRDDFIREYLPGGASGQVRSACGRFGLIAAAGEIATSFDLTGWPKGEATQAVVTCFQAWLDKRGTIGDHDLEVGIRQVISYIERYGNSRFQCVGSNPDDYFPPLVQNRVGFRQIVPTGTSSQYEYWVLAEAWKNELCKGYNATVIAKEMAERGQLLKQSGRLAANRRCGHEGQHRVYRLLLGEPDMRDAWEKRADWIASEMGTVPAYSNGHDTEVDAGSDTKVDTSDTGAIPSESPLMH
jgi:uncharacterized protein (DUF927 family)